MKTSQLRQKYLDFFKKQGHAIVPSASLIPENDPTTLFTGSGMQSMMPYLLGEKHPLGTRITDSQKCFRTQDIDEVGDNRHTTFFEMLGNWSFGDYFKKEQISWFFSFLTKNLKLDPDRLYITCFRGTKDIPKDEEAAKLWQEQFAAKKIAAPIADHAERDGMQGGRIFYYDETKNWWSRAGIPADMPVGEPGGPDSEIFWDFGEALQLHEQSSFKDQSCHVNCDCGRFLEIGNSVFMTYAKTEKGFEELPQKNIDFGGGLERTMMAVADTPDMFLIDVFEPMKKTLEKRSQKKYEHASEAEKQAFRVIMDHLRAATFLIHDGALPSNKDQGYFTRRLIRRSVRYGQQLDITNFCAEAAQAVVKAYPEYDLAEERVMQQMQTEEETFTSTLAAGLKRFEKLSRHKKTLSGEEAFLLFQSYGFPREMTEELAREKGVQVDVKGFEKAFAEHQEISRKGAAQKFKGGLQDHSAETTKLHTATHLLNEALRRVVSTDIRQRGSNITQERLRFDFRFDRKLTPEELQKVEALVNDIIAEDLKVTKTDMSPEEALKKGAQAEFGTRYLAVVSVYTIGDFSKEICGGPHVRRTSELGTFRITKEESSSAGVRRIRAVLE